MSSAKGANKRKKRRYRVRDFQVEFTPDNLFSFFRRASSERNPLVDMSTEGLQFLSRKELKLGETIQITISAPIFASPIKGRGKVVWSQQIPRQTLFRTGVELTDLDEDTQKKLDAFEEKVQDLSIRVLCNSCGSAFKVKKKHEGARGRCPNCKKAIEIVEAVPEGPQAKSGVHVAATAIGGGIAGFQDIPLKLQRFLQRTCTSRLHLAIIIHLHNSRATVLSPEELAKDVGQSPRATRAACKDLEMRGILKAVGTKAFNYAPSDSAKKDIAELMRLHRDARKRSRLLAFVLENEKRRR